MTPLVPLCGTCWLEPICEDRPKAATASVYYCHDYGHKDDPDPEERREVYRLEEA
jgi:hypothetical protein